MKTEMTEMEIALSCVALAGVLAAPLLYLGTSDPFFESLPIGVAVFALLVAALAAISIMLRRVRSGNALPARRPLLIAVAMILSAVIVPAVVHPSAGLLSWLMKSAPASEIAFAVLALVTLSFAIVVIAFPIWAIVRVAICLRGRDCRNAIRFATIPVLCVCLFLVGQSIGNRVAIYTIGPIIQSAIHDAGNGRRFSRSQSSLVFVADGEPKRAYYVLNSFTDGALYLVYDPADSGSSRLVKNISALIDLPACRILPSPIGEGYYLTRIPC